MNSQRDGVAPASAGSRPRPAGAGPLFASSDQLPKVDGSPREASALPTGADPQTLASALTRFGLTAFRPGQREIIDAVMAGRDCLGVMPTGGGKSLCYQLPALLMPGTTIVISPLIALMKDQEDQLRATCGQIRVAALHSGLDPEVQRERLDQIAAGALDLVYLAPERLRSGRFLEIIGRIRLALLAVDEAHCISEWGHDFRPDYGRLGWFRQKLGMPTTIALTATATDTVRRDIVEQLRLRDPAVFIRGFDRPNLRYRVTETKTRAQKSTRIKEMLEQTPGSVIVYTSSRKACEEVAAFIRERCRRSVTIYHAGLLSAERHRAQEAFMAGRTDVVVATNAFGMGVDKANVRGVVHYNLPGTLEAYYQEAGRAGRDGQPALCELLFSFADKMIQEYFIDSEYPDRALVGTVLDFLRAQPDDLVELTRAEMVARLGLKVSEMAIGACLKLLEAAGAVERLRPRENMAIVRIHESGPDLTDLLPANATLQRAVVRGLQALVGPNRGQDCYFNPDHLAARLGIDRAVFTRAARELTERLDLEYIPPFRGNATRLLDRQSPLEQFSIDFEQLQTRKEREYGKLDGVLRYAGSGECRRKLIMEYFGDRPAACGNCDNCQRSGRGAALAAGPAGVISANAAAAVRHALSGLAELRGRFGKTTVAQVLTGAANQRTARFGFDARQCFGQFRRLRQTDVVELLDALKQAELAAAGGDPFRPTIEITPAGAAVLRGAPLPPTLRLSADLWRRLETPSVAGQAHTSAAVSPQAGEPAAAAPTPDHPAADALDNPPAPIPLGDRPGTNRTTDQAQRPNTADPATRRPASPLAASQPAWHWTWRVLHAGFSIAEVCAIRHLEPQTVLDHATSAASQGLGVPLAPFRSYPFGPELRAKFDRLVELATPREAP